MWEIKHDSVTVAHQHGLWPVLLPPSSFYPPLLYVSTSLPPVNSTDTTLQSNPILATYVTLYRTVISCLSSLTPFPPPLCPCVCVCVCLSQTGRSPHWPCCWGEHPSSCSPSLWPWYPCASAPGVAATSPWLSYCSLQVCKEEKGWRIVQK